MKTRRSILLALALTIGLRSLSLANGSNLNGLGTRAVSMGGAFVGAGRRLQRHLLEPGGPGRISRPGSCGFYGVDIIPSASYLMQVPDLDRPRDPGRCRVAEQALSVRTGRLLPADQRPDRRRRHRHLHPFRPRQPLGTGTISSTSRTIKWGWRPLTARLPWESKIGQVIRSRRRVSYKINDHVLHWRRPQRGLRHVLLEEVGRHRSPAAPVHHRPRPVRAKQQGWGFGATFGALFKPNTC